jgi:ATP-dependent protease ClpP protease subunit
MTMNSRVLSQHVEFTLYDSISSFSDAKEFTEKLGAMKSEDRVTLKINSGGGRIDVGHMIVQAIQSSQAHVTAHVVHASYSMASLIALSCDDLKFEPHSLLMFHNYSSGNGGKGAALVQGVLSSDEYIKGIFYDICTPFLTKAEMKNIIDDRDLYIKWNDAGLKARIDRHYKGRKNGR